MRPTSQEQKRPPQMWNRLAKEKWLLLQHNKNNWERDDGIPAAAEDRRIVRWTNNTNFLVGGKTHLMIAPSLVSTYKVKKRGSLLLTFFLSSI